MNNIKLFGFHPSAQPLYPVSFYVLADSKEDALEILRSYWDDDELTTSYGISDYADCFYLDEENYDEDFELKADDVIYSKFGEFQLKKEKWNSWKK